MTYYHAMTFSNKQFKEAQCTCTTRELNKFKSTEGFQMLDYAKFSYNPIHVQHTINDRLCALGLEGADFEPNDKGVVFGKVGDNFFGFGVYRTPLNKKENSGIIDTTYCVNEVRRLKEEGYSVKIIVCYIADAYKKYEEGKRLTQKDKFFLGLRYSEFLAVDSSNYDLALAEEKRQELLRVLGISAQELNMLCKEMCNLK